MPDTDLNFLSQPQGQNLDEIVVSVPQTPAHGAVARLPSQVNKQTNSGYSLIYELINKNLDVLCFHLRINSSIESIMENLEAAIHWKCNLK